nr:scarecrow-like protein 14 isoform X2 [Ipomoea batatas]
MGCPFDYTVPLCYFLHLQSWTPQMIGMRSQSQLKPENRNHLLASYPPALFHSSWKPPLSRSNGSLDGFGGNMNVPNGTLVSNANINTSVPQNRRVARDMSSSLSIAERTVHIISSRGRSITILEDDGFEEERSLASNLQFMWKQELSELL